MDKNELELINRFTRRSFGEDDIYAFSVVLCDNEIDRDFERFSDEALEELSKLYVGVTGVADHDPKSSNQSARIFSCRVEAPEGKLTSDGRQYKRLCARAYMPKSEGSEELILALDSGIKKEVSVGCAVKKRICSICGEDISGCDHIKGRKYAGRLCYAVLDEPADAYEWSFVAVPAQKNAGVIKGLEIKGGSDMMKKTVRLSGMKSDPRKEKGGIHLDIEKKLFAGEEQSFSADELKELVRRFRSLEKKAADGEFYRDSLLREVKGLCAVVFPEIGSETIHCISETLSVRQLDEIRKAFEAKASEILPVKPQLCRSNTAVNSGSKNTIYKNI